MILASILFVGLVPLGPGDDSGRAMIAVPGAFRVDAPASDLVARPDPDRVGRGAILDCEESEEDPSDDDPSPGSALGFLSRRIVALSDDPLARRGAAPFSSRSASPTLRLRC